MMAVAERSHTQGMPRSHGQELHVTGKIHLKGVRAYGYVGHLPAEQDLGQWFEVDATLWVDFEAATRSDDLNDTLDYRRCIACIETLIQTSRFALIERLAGAIADDLLKDPKIERLALRVTKCPPIPNFLGTVAVEIARERPLSATPIAAPTTKLATPAIAVPAPTAPEREGPEIERIYADGACSKNPGPGGWGVLVLNADGSKVELGGGKARTTNNQMELQAAIAALEYYRQSGQAAPIDLFTDSRYVMDGITQWIKGWKQNGWLTKDKKPVKNRELWQQLEALNSDRVRWHWVEGHSGDPGNDRADAIARSYAAQDR